MIRSCGALVSDETPENRKNLCQTLFETLSEVADLDISHYNQLLRVFVENEFDFDAINFLERMQTKGVDPNRVTFMLMIDWFCRKGNLSEAIRILEHMKSKDMAITESVFNSLIIGYGKVGDLETAEQTLEMMRSSGAEPSSDTYTALLCAYAFNSKNPETVEKINKTFDEITKSENDLSEAQLFKVIKTLALNDCDGPLLDQILKSIKKTIYYNKECLNVINELMFANKVDVALKLYYTMEASEAQIKQKNVGHGLIRSMVRANIAPEVVFGVCEKLESEGGENGLQLATEMALNYANVDVCRTYLKRMADKYPIRVHYFFPLIVKCETEDQVLDVLSKDMAPFVNASYSQLMELFVDYIWPKNILDVNLFIEKCRDIGFSVTVTLNSLIRYYIGNNRLPDALQIMTSPIYSTVNLIKRELIYDLTETAFNPNTNVDDITRTLQVIHSRQKQSPSESGLNDTFGQYLLSLIRRKLPQNQLNKILESFGRNNVKISNISVDTIRDRIPLSEQNEKILNKLSTKNLDDLRGVVYHDIDDITKPRKEMTPEELEGHLIELRSKGLNTRGVLRNLLMSYCRRTRVSDDERTDPLVIEAQKRVHQILEELKESEFQFSNAMYAMVMDFFANCGDIEAALDIKSKIADEFVLDWYKIINLATLFVQNGQIERGMDLIRSELKRKIDSNNREEQNSLLTRSRDKTIYRFLNSLIEANADIDLLKEAFDLCLQYSRLVPTSVMAGPLVKYYILKGDYSGALKELNECVEKYRITPWKNQLMKHFLETGDQSNLQIVLDHSNRVHGQMNTIIELAGICIELGKVKQAKKLLDTPGLRVKQAKIDMMCESMVRDDNIEALEQLIRLSRSVFDLNRDRMLYHLIRGCIKLNDTEKALGCWTLMQEENIQPSDETLILLANFLERNGVSVPFTVPPTRSAEQSQSSKEGTSQTQRSDDDPLHKFNVALKASDIDEALKIRNSLQSEGKSLLMSQNCSLIEALLNSDRIDEAFAISQSLLSSKLFPSPRIIRYLCSKLSAAGDYQRLEELGSLLPEFLAQNNSFTNALSIAYINSGKTAELIDKLTQLKPFPLGAFLRALDIRPELESRLIGIANDLVRETDYHLPLNMVWINLMNKGRYEDADNIYKSCPKLKDFLLFTSLLDSIRENRNIELAKKLIQTVSQSNLTPKSIGVTYSALIDAYLESGDISSAESVVVNDIVNASITRTDPKTGQQVKLGVEHLTRSTLRKLIKSIQQTEGREPKFAINGQPMTANESSSDESSDDDVVDVKNK